jgi:phosphoribosyl 1,2-cyclic phosphate phosphodiesterase
MKVTFLGTGTSQGIPVIGCNCKTCLSDDFMDNRLRVSVQIEINDKIIVIDVGPDFRQQMLKAGTIKIDAILITHEHSDHVAGIDDIRPFNFMYKMDMPFYATANVQKVLIQKHPYIFEARYPGVPRIKLHTISKAKKFKVADISVVPIEIFHGKLAILGFRIGDFAYLTDFKTIDDKEVLKLKGIKVLVVSALQHKTHHSHSSFQESVDFVNKIGVPKAYFTHISHKMGSHIETENLLPKHIRIAYDGLVIEV